MKKGLLLLSGGIDSPVAGKLLLERGMRLGGIHFHTQPFTSDESEKKARKLAEMLGLEKLFIVPFGEQSSRVVKECGHRFYYVITRRLMWRIAERIAREEGYDFLVTGENMGQVSSQTLDNMSVTDKAVSIPVIRPVLANDKNETVELARKCGTFEVSKGPEVCCALGPKNPVTRSKLGQVEAEESRLDISGIVSGADYIEMR